MSVRARFVQSANDATSDEWFMQVRKLFNFQPHSSSCIEVSPLPFIPWIRTKAVLIHRSPEGKSDKKDIADACEIYNY